MSTIARTHAVTRCAASTSRESASTFDTEQQSLTAMDPRLLGAATISVMLSDQEDEGATCSHTSKSSEEDDNHHEDSSKLDLDNDLPDNNLSQEDRSEDDDMITSDSQHWFGNGSALLLAMTRQLDALDNWLTQGSNLSAALGHDLAVCTMRVHELVLVDVRLHPFFVLPEKPVSIAQNSILFFGGDARADIKQAAKLATDICSSHEVGAMSTQTCKHPIT
ncbi:hypothetical protein BC828DRAFT_409721 [Blastocladiella britannica]|nr:hypothetical protein BC828DRAFT_409721 [Blastocladiella britannica]